MPDEHAPRTDDVVPASQGPARVVSVSTSRTHSFTKPRALSLTLVAGHGVVGDAHFGATVKHRSRVARDPTQPNLRQVHLMHRELFDELAAQGFAVGPGELGENVTTEGIDLLALPAGTRLAIGDEVVLEVTGLRNPCVQIDRFQRGLMKAVLGRTREGALVRKAGVMSVVMTGGEVRAGDAIGLHLPPRPHRPLEVV